MSKLVAALCFWTLTSLATATPQDQFGVIGRIQRITVGEGGFVGRGTTEGFGSSIAVIDDLDGDGIPEVAVGAERQRLTSNSIGAVWILFLRSDGTVRAEEGITTNDGGFIRGLEDGDRFGCSVAALGDVDGDGIGDLAVGSEGDDDGSSGTGAIRILFLNESGTVRAQQKISELEGGLSPGTLVRGNQFGRFLAPMGDLDGDGTPDVAVAASRDQFFGDSSAAAFVLLLNPDGTVKAHATLDAATLGLTGDIGMFAASVAAAGDLDGDGRTELAIGARGVGGTGAIHVVFLDPDASVTRVQTLTNSSAFGGALTASDVLGETCSTLGDFDGDGRFELFTGRSPAPWIVSLEADGSAASTLHLTSDRIEIASTPIAPIMRDVDGDGLEDLVFGDHFANNTRGAIYVCFRCDSAPASESRNPGGTNPFSLSIAPPALGAMIDATVDLSTTGHAATTIFGYAGSLTATLGGGQVLLMDVSHPSGELLQLPLRTGPVATYMLQVPNVLALCGVRVSTQALHLFRVLPYALSNAVDLTLGPAGGGSL